MPHAYSSSCVPSQEDGREGPQPPHIQTTHGADSLPPPPPLPNGRRRRRILPCRRGPRRCGSRSRSRSRSRRRRRSGSGSGRLLPRGGLRPASRLCRLRRPGPRPFCRGAGADADAGAGAGPGEGGRCPLGFRIFRIFRFRFFFRFRPTPAAGVGVPTRPARPPEGGGRQVGPPLSGGNLPRPHCGRQDGRRRRERSYAVAVAVAAPSAPSVGRCGPAVGKGRGPGLLPQREAKLLLPPSSYFRSQGRSPSRERRKRRRRTW